MNMRDIMDFSRESRFQGQLLQKIKAECFGALSDDDLELVSAAGTGNVPAIMVNPGVIPNDVPNREQT